MLLLNANKFNKQMELDHDDLTQQPIKKMNSSNAAFRELIQNLRIKNRKTTKKAFSQFNPESDCTNSSQACFSEALCHNNAERKINLLSTPMLINNSNVPNSNGLEDNAIKLKPRRSVAGRDKLNEKYNNIPSETFNETVASLKEQQKYKKQVINTKQYTPKKDNAVQEVLTHPKILKSPTDNKVANNLSKYLNNLSSMENIQHPSYVQIKQLEGQRKVDHPMKNNVISTEIQSKIKTFNQNKLNSKLAKNTKIKDIDEQLVIRYYRNANNLSKSSQAPDIFDFFENILKITKISVQRPLIKKFKNCIYFGQQINENQKYEGFLYFYDYKFYYGEFCSGQKNGNGVQIIFEPNQIIYKGTFNSGEKTGKFYVRDNSQMEQYVGHLDKGVYQGKGKLIQKESVYEGDFVNGQKHGFGQQYHPRNGVKFTGYFNRGQFQKRSKSSFDKEQLEKGIRFRESNSRTKGVKKLNTKMQRTNRSHADIISNNKTSSRFMNEKDKYFGQVEATPFSSSMGFNGPHQNNSKNNQLFYNKQKIRGYIPPVRSHFNQPMPQNFQDFDYSFDISSRRDSDASQFMPIVYDKRTNSVRRKNVPEYNYNTPGNSQMYGFPAVSQFPQITQQKLDTHESQQPLPMPCFLPRR